MMKTTGRTLVVVAALSLAEAWAGEADPAGKTPLAAAAAFETLKQLAGSWDGHILTPGGPPGSVTFEVTSGGTALRERMFPDTPHEMMNVYHLDGEDLVVTHYCHGNQPRLRLAREASGPAELVFDFAGGSNIDPATSAHMHAARIRLVGPDRLQADWDSWKDGKRTDTKSFYLSRRKQASRARF